MSSPTRDNSASAPQGMSYDILIVDDHEVNLLLATRLVQRYGYTATAASSGEAAVELTARHAFRLVLMDYQMPGIDGIETTRQIRARESAGGRRVPIVGVSASASDTVRRDCLAAGMDDYLEKPFDFDALEAALRKWVGEPDRSMPASASAPRTTP